MYSHPLFTYGIIGLVAGVADRWLLQVFHGSIEQGFFGLSYQIGAICFLATSAMTPLLTREFAVAYSKNDLPLMASLFRRYIPLFYSIAAYFSCFVVMNAEKVTYIFGGKKFQHASMAVAIMAFYPIHQTYGQLSGSVFYASGNTRLYRDIGIIFMLLGLPVAYFLLAPSNRMGLECGATGLAIKMVALQFVAVNAQLYFNAKFLKLPFGKYLAHQIVCVALFLFFAWCSSLVTTNAFGDQRVLLSFLLSGITYTLIVLLTAYFAPRVFGLKRDDLRGLLRY